MNLIINDEHGYKIGLDKQIQLICSLVDEELGFLPGDVNLVLCSDKQIQELNLEHRDKDAVTDVLTFTYYADSEQKPNERPMPQEGDLLGDIFLDIDQCRRQAANPENHEHKNWSTDQEVFKLCIHGLVHLRGYDHVEDEDYRVMKLIEDKIMKRFNESV